MYVYICEYNRYRLTPNGYLLLCSEVAF